MHAILPLIPLSSMLDIVQFMLPATDEYLLYTYIDEEMSPNKRGSITPVSVDI